MSDFEDGYNKALFDMTERVKLREMQGLKPAKFSTTQTVDELAEKVHEEMAEWVLALKQYKRKPTRCNRLHLLSESADVQFAQETFMCSLEPVAEGRDAVRSDVANGNAYVGYYNDKYGSQKGTETLYRLFRGRELIGQFTTCALMYEEVANRTTEDKAKGESHTYTFKVYKLQEDGTAFDGECGF